MNSSTQQQLAALADAFVARREEILDAWRAAVEGDAELQTASTLSRSQFNDHIPEVLSIFADKLRVCGDDSNAARQQHNEMRAVEHGLHRWQQGFALGQMMREWGHLHIALLEELARYEAHHPELEIEAEQRARLELAVLIHESISHSAVQYTHLQQSEAEGRLRDLQQALAHAADLERRRAEALREVSHDLRGSLSVVSGATSILRLEDIPEDTRDEFLTLLQNGVGALNAMLDEMMQLARLEAGHEKRVTESFDAAVLLTNLGATSQPIAFEEKLSLEVRGPESLVVEGDASKVRRIAQNLLLNALKYTERGGVTLTWRIVDDKRWMFCVIDTGPGIENLPGASMGRELKEATELARGVEAETARDNGAIAKEEKASLPCVEDDSPDSTTSFSAPVEYSKQHEAGSGTVHTGGEGIGLSIVKRLCELLDAAIELQSEAGRGSSFHVVLPRYYNEPPLDAQTN